MTQHEFTRLLFRAAFCVMACDGKIDDREIEELRLIHKNTRYFRGLDLEAELQIMIGDVREHGRRFVLGLLAAIENAELNIVQELLLLEICMRIVNADEHLDEKEVRFLRHLRRHMSVHDEIITQRFGRVEYLVQSSVNDLELQEQAKADTGVWALPPMEELEKVHIDVSAS